MVGSISSMRGASFVSAILLTAAIATKATAQCDIWQPLGSGLDGRVFGLVVYNGDVIAGGEFGGPGSLNHIARWNGSTWQPLGTGLTGHWVEPMVVFNGELVAGGLTDLVGYIARWTGSTWQPLGSGLSSYPHALTVYNGELIAGGDFITAGGVLANHTARWNGSAWQPLGAGVGGSVFALTVYNGELIAGQVGGGVDHWNGSTWQTLGTGVGGQVHALTVYNGELIAGGFNGVAHWNGSTWQILGTSAIGHVYALGVYNGDLIAGGTFTIAGSHIARWNGSSWESIGGGIPDEQVIAVSVYDGQLIAGGFFGSPGNHIARWRACHPLPHPGVTNPPTVPVYQPPPPPTPTQRNLIVVTHGWRGLLDQIPPYQAAQTFDSFWVPLADEMVSHAIEPQKWQSQAYNWIGDAGPSPNGALNNGLMHGIALGIQIGLQHYDHVHLVAHSAGSALIGMASLWIKIVSPQTIVHTTFLDSYVAAFSLSLQTGIAPKWPGILTWLILYGGPSDWSEQYYSLEFPIFGLCGSTSILTQVAQPGSHNVDVSHVDPCYALPCLSTHKFPYQFYRYTVSGEVVPGWTGDGCTGDDLCGYLPYGFDLSYEKFSALYTPAEWAAAMNRQFERGNFPAVVLGCKDGVAGGGVAGEPNLVFGVRHDPPMSLATTPYQTSDGGTLVVNKENTGFTALTQPEGAKVPTDAWITLGLDLAQIVNFVQFEVNFASEPGARGVLTIYVDDEEVGFLDEQYISLAPGTYSMQSAGDLAPGLHTLSFRLDHFDKVPSTVSVTNIATGYGAFVPLGDLNFDQVVNSIDLGILLSSWSLPDSAGSPGCGGAKECPADLNSDGHVNSIDLGILLANWTL